jgi:hypothetical protein
VRIQALLLTSLLSCACADSAPAPAATPQAAGPVAVIALSAGQKGDAAGHATVDVTVPPSAPQVRLELSGISQSADELTAELEARPSGEVRRWPVDAAAGGVSVTVPGYAVAAGEHVLTLWQGDADVVARYRFRVRVP